MAAALRRRGGSRRPTIRCCSELAVATTALDLLQICRRDDAAHGAGLAIPDFPLAFGHVIPPHWDAEDRHPLRASRRRADRHDPRSWRRPATSSTITGAAASCVRPSMLLLVAARRADHARRADGALERAASTSSIRCTSSPARRVLVTSLVLTLRAHRARFASTGRCGAPPSQQPSSGPARQVCRAASVDGGPPDRHDRRTRMRLMLRLPVCIRRARRFRRHGHDGAAHRLADFVTLTKPRLNLLVLVTTLAGLYLASPDGVPPRCWCTRWSGRRSSPAAPRRSTRSGSATPTR